MKMKEGFVREWKDGPYTLRLYDKGQDPGRIYRQRLGYRFEYKGELIFEGDDFFPSPVHPIDSDQTVASLLHFLSLRPGDTDDEYFEDYTDRQMEFALNQGEHLSLLAHEMEERDERIQQPRRNG